MATNYRQPYRQLYEVAVMGTGLTAIVLCHRCLSTLGLACNTIIINNTPQPRPTAPAAPNLDAALWAAVRQPIERTWDAIGADVLEAAGGNPVGPYEAMEAVLDGHMDVYGGEGGTAATALVRAAAAHYGWYTVTEFLAHRAHLGA
jgi:hypothetical protein